MATTTVSDAVVFPQSQGTGLSSETAQADALLFSALAQYQGGEYVNQNLLSSLAFRNHDATNDQVGVGPGVCYIVDDSSSTGGNRNASGNPQGESTTSSGYDFALADHAYVVVIPTEVTVDCSDSTLNQVWVNITDVTSDNAVELRTDGGGGTTAQPSDTFVKIGETNPDDASADTRANPGASPTFESVSTGEVSIANTGAEGYPTTDTTLTDSTYTKIPLDAALFEDSNVSVDTSNNRLEINTAGRYELSASLRFRQYPDQATAYARIYLNGSSTRRTHVTVSASSGGDETPSLTALRDLSVGDTITLQAIQFTGSDQTVQSDNGESTHLSAIRVA